MSKDVLHFADEAAYSRIIETPRQLLTVRTKPKQYKTGDAVQATFTNHHPELVRIISQVKQPIQEIHPALLLLDGFVNPPAVLDMLNTYYPQARKKWQLHSPVVRTMFIPEWLNESSEPSEKIRLFHGEKVYKTSDYELSLIKDPVFENLFYPAFYYWLIHFHGISESNYPAELQARDLVSAEQAAGMTKLYAILEKSRKKTGKKNEERTAFLAWHYVIGDTAERLDL